MLIADKINLAIAVATALSALVSAVMAAMTWAILRANRATVEVMRSQIEATSRPFVQIAPIVRPSTTAIELHIRNVGTTAACQLRLTLDRDYHFNALEGQQYNLRGYAAFTKEIQMLAPGSELRFLLGIGNRILGNASLCPLQFTIQAEYGFHEKTVKEKTIVDLEPFGKSNQPIDPMIERMDKLIAELETIRRQMSNVNQ